MPSARTTSATIISKMKKIFAEHGVPDIPRSDNGSQYASAAFIEFTEEWGFQHTASSPYYPASNGFAESMMKIIKTVLTKAKNSVQKPSTHTISTLHYTARFSPTITSAIVVSMEVEN